jgi:hypothetical protein
MRYLYGDSAPFPLQYNFLSALQTFIANAARAVQLDAEVRAVKATQATVEASRARALEELGAFHKGAMKALEGAIPKDAMAPTLTYVKQITERSAQIVDETTAQLTQATEQERAHARGEIETRRAEARTALANFLAVLRLAVDETEVSLRLVDGRNELSAVFKTAPALVAGFTLSTREVLAWHHPRKVGEFAKGVQLAVGVRRSWFGKGVQHESTGLDDYVISGFDLSEERADIWLRKKATERDSLVLNIRRDGDKLAAEVHHPGDPEAEGLPTALDASQIEQLDRLWQLLRAGVADVLPHKERLDSLEIEGEDVCATDRVVPFVEQVIKLLAPTVGEISRRSPNPAELSLKMETEGGRREEFYVKKADLVAKLEGLGTDERKLFSPLAIENGDRERKTATSVPDDSSWDRTN